MNKKSYIMSISTIASVVFALLVATSLGQAKAAEDLTVDFYFDIKNRKVTMKPGETLSFESDLISPKEKALTLRTGITSEGKEGIYAIAGKQILPDGVTTELDKAEYKLAKEIGKSGLAPREKGMLKLQVNPDAKDGEYPLSYFLYKDLGNGTYLISAEHFMLVIDKTK